MADSFLVSNFHSLCRLCLHKRSLMVPIFEIAPDDDKNMTVNTKIACCLELQMAPDDGLPDKICYQCFYKVEKWSNFKVESVQNEARLRQIYTSLNIKNSDLSESQSYDQIQNNVQKPQTNYLVEESLVMVVDPSLEYDSTEESENIEILDKNVPGNELSSDSFFRNVAMCQYCDQAFISQEKCTEHEQNVHDPNLPFNCFGCSLEFAERSQFIQHTKQVHGIDKPHHCPECSKSFGRRSDLRKHSIVHTGLRPYQCHLCMKNFSRNTNLSKHLRIHAGQKPHVCPKCPRSFVAQSDLQKHVLVHSNLKPFSCTKCPLTFSRRDKLVKHQMRHEKSEANASVNSQSSQNMVVNVNPFNNFLLPSVQTNCNENSDSDLPRVPDHISGESSFQNQVQKNLICPNKPSKSPPKPKPIIQKPKPKNIKCHQCPKRLPSLDAYKKHVSLAHIGSRVFQCRVCFKKFPRKRELDRHALLHNATFSCKNCKETFSDKDKFTKHEESKECLEVNMPCIECGVTFVKKADLVSHIKSHIAEEIDMKPLEIVPKLEFSLDPSFYDLEA